MRIYCVMGYSEWLLRSYTATLTLRVRRVEASNLLKNFQLLPGGELHKTIRPAGKLARILFEWGCSILNQRPWVENTT